MVFVSQSDLEFVFTFVTLTAVNRMCVLNITLHFEFELRYSHLKYFILCRVKPGPRDLYANLIKVSTPNNFYPCNLALAIGIGQFHGMRLRHITGGQCPVVVYKSRNRGKSQGKSGVARMVCYLTSDWKSNRLSPKISNETIKKKFSYTTCPIYFDDVKGIIFLILAFLGIKSRTNFLTPVLSCLFVYVTLLYICQFA